MTTIEAMRLAIEEAKKGYGFVSPNPVVGCVILDKNGHLLSTGYHAQVGQGHAEVEALKKVADPKQLDGAHVIVTLEPCSHFGRTPPCADRLAEYPIQKVTYGLLDPNPQVAGQGIAKLKAKGIVVEECTELREELEDLAEIFLFNMREQKTFAALKVATSLDGAVAFKSGESKWITSEESRHYAHFLRGQYDAVLVGSGTLLKDNPKLDVRHEKFKSRAPNKVVIFDLKASTLNRLKEMQVAKVRPLENIYVVTAADQISNFSKLGIFAISAKSLQNGILDLSDVMKELYKHKIYSVYVEGGAETLSSFITQKSAQRLYQFIAPKILGAQHSRVWTEKVGFENMQSALQLNGVQFQNFGSDILLSGRFFSRD